MRQRKIVLSLAAAGPVTAVLISSCAPAAHNGANSNLTVQCTESLTGQDVTDGGVAGTGHCTLTGGLHDSGPTTDYRTQKDTTILIRRVVTGANGTITFLITINTAGPAPWTITSGTKTYAKLHGRGHQVVDNYTDSPATFVLKGTVSQIPSLNQPARPPAAMTFRVCTGQVWLLKDSLRSRLGSTTAPIGVIPGG